MVIVFNKGFEKFKAFHAPAWAEGYRRKQRQRKGFEAASSAQGGAGLNFIELYTEYENRGQNGT